MDFLEQECSVCHHPFNKEDDVVVCPDCGAPHHRACWLKENRCAYADKHGTPEQWRPMPSRRDEDAVICGNCGTANREESRFCVKCGHVLGMDDARSPSVLSGTAPVFFGNKVPDLDVGNEQAATDAAAFIGSNANYYLERFELMKKQNRILSWNWCAAFFPVEWFVYRKMYKWAYIVCMLMLLLMLPSLYEAALSVLTMSGDAAAYQAYLSSGQLPDANIPHWLSTLTDIASTLLFFLRGTAALFANYLYRQHVFQRMERIRKECTDPLLYRYTLSKKGGTNLGGVIVYIVLLILAAFFGSFALLFSIQ